MNISSDGFLSLSDLESRRSDLKEEEVDGDLEAGGGGGPPARPPDLEERTHLGLVPVLGERDVQDCPLQAELGVAMTAMRPLM